MHRTRLPDGLDATTDRRPCETETPTMTFDKNPFPSGDADRHALWEMLVRRDIDAFIGQEMRVHAKEALGDEVLLDH
ncbi:MAG: hypothetical protein E5W64_17635, partial [Mesorhizobium sp.]